MLLDDESAWHFKATRDLGPGTELFLTYGAHFWLSKIIHNATTSPLVRLLLYLYLLDAQTTLTGSGDDGQFLLFDDESHGLHSFPLVARIYLDDNGTPILPPPPSNGHHHRGGGGGGDQGPTVAGEGGGEAEQEDACKTFMRDVLGLSLGGRGGGKQDVEEKGQDAAAMASSSSSRDRTARKMAAPELPSAYYSDQLQALVRQVLNTEQPFNQQQ
jgi:hypothetical protein